MASTKQAEGAGPLLRAAVDPPTSISPSFLFSRTNLDQLPHTTGRMTRLPHPPLLALALAVTLVAGVSGIMPSAQRFAKRAADPAGPVPIDLSKYVGQTVMVVAVSLSLFFSSGSMWP